MLKINYYDKLVNFQHLRWILSSFPHVLQLDLGNVMDQLPGYYVFKNTESQYCFANSNAAHLLGFKSPEELVGYTDYNLKCEASQYAEEFIKEDQLTLLHHHLKFISHFCYANHDWRTCFYEKKVTRNSSGDLIGINCYVTDVTDNTLIDLTRYLLTTDQKYHYEFRHHQFAYLIHEGYLDIKLTDRETECLFFVLRGKTSKAIAKILAISIKTVEYYIEQLKIKLACSNKSELIERALTNGYLNILPKHLANSSLLKKTQVE